jgi:hypothetical protein
VPAFVTLTDFAGFCDNGVYAWKALDWLVAFVRAPRSRATKKTPATAPAQAPAYIPQPSVQAAARAYLAAQRNASAPTPTLEKTDA